MSDGSSHFWIKEEPLSDGEGNGDQRMVRILPNPVEEAPIIKLALECNYCDSTFSSITDLQTHETSHPTTQNVACTKCGEDFDVTETVKRLSIHGEKCISLFKITTTRGTKETAIPKSFAIAKYLCKYCRVATIESQAKLTEHRKNIHNICDHCGKMFEYQSNLKRHLESLSKGGKKGPSIPPGTTSEGATEDPQKATGEKRKRSQDETPQSATKKRKGLPSSSVPTATITSEHPVGGTRPVPISKEVTEPPFVCEECHRFVSVTDFEGHVLEKHPGYKPFKCAICFEEFAKLNLLEQHYKQVHNYKP